MPAFTYTQAVRFADCDPAGIVYFPRIMEMVNNLTEDWFAEGLGMSFEAFHLQLRYGIPVVNTRIEFLKACRLGERLSFELTIETLGRSSVVLRIAASVAGEPRIKLRHKVAMFSMDTHRAVAIPDELRARMTAFVIPDAKPSPESITHDGIVPDTAFRSKQLVRFAHCDPAGIVFYPRFFDMLNCAVEDWFAQGLHCPWGGDFMDERNLRIPSLWIAVEFLKPCRLSETIDFDLWPTRLGRSTIEIGVQGTVAGVPRLRAAQTMCIIDFASFKSTPIPADLRERMEGFLPV
jgi:4-hydroxybenzoyl-CoA thioesterase